MNDLFISKLLFTIYHLFRTAILFDRLEFTRSWATQKRVGNILIFIVNTFILNESLCCIFRIISDIKRITTIHDSQRTLFLRHHKFLCDVINRVGQFKDEINIWNRTIRFLVGIIFQVNFTTT